jgi:predicted transcriptional regulator
VINENTNRGDAIVMILQATNVSGGMNLTKIREKMHLIITSQQLKEYLSSLEKNGLMAFQKGEQVYRTTYKGMHFLQTYNYTIGLMNSVEK